MHDLAEDPETVAALFEAAAPELPPPVAILREPDGPRGVARYAVRTRGGAFRLKLGLDGASAAAVAHGVSALPALAGAGLVVPASLAWRPGAEGVPAVAVERRLGATDAAVAWPVLGPAGRDAVLGAAVGALAALHALPASVVPGGSAGGWRERVRRCADRHLGRLTDRDDVPAATLAAVRDVVGQATEALAADLPLAPCHGAPGLRELTVERRAFSGWRDFEALRLGDPVLDLAHLSFAIEGPEATRSGAALVAAWGRAGGDERAARARIPLYRLLLTAAAVAAIPPGEAPVSLALLAALSAAAAARIAGAA
ncbi:MAG: phosphotransferase [Planctomycetes bacterium]|nr:phosphotransferase [Planctomycetota bacterium]